LTDLSLGNQHYHAAPIRKLVDERVFENRGVCGQAFPSLLSPPPPRTFLRPPQFSRGQKSEKRIERAESLTETLATQAKKRSFLMTFGRRGVNVYID